MNQVSATVYVQNTLISCFIQTRDKLDWTDIKCYLLVPHLLVPLHI